MVPKGTKFSVARQIIVNDFNNDNLDDLFFIQHGPDVPNKKFPQKNEIMLSSKAGYKVRYAPGEKSIWHGGAAGDIDNDGDIDVIASPLLNKLGEMTDIGLYENTGQGTFTFKRLFKNVGRIYFLELWDINRDGYLDILMDGHEEDLKISFGKKNGFFSKPKTFLKTPNSLTQAIDFADIDNDGIQDVIRLSSLSTDISKKKYSYDMYYGGFEIEVLKLDQGRVLSSNTITKHIHPKGHHSWLARLSACDIKNDGKMDIVYEKIGEGNFFTNYNIFGQKDYNPSYDWSKTDKVIWFNKGDSKFEIIRFEDPMYFRDNSRFQNRENEKYIKQLYDHADKHGVSLRKFVPGKVYYETDDKKLFRRNDKKLQPYPFYPLEIQ
jgi:hypothetical protein